MADSIGIIRLKSSEHAHRTAAEMPENSSRALVEAALNVAFIEGAQAALEVLRDQLVTL